MTRLYFDTNVYRLIRATKETARLARLLAAQDCILIASSGNLFETYAIASPEERQEELAMLVATADEFESHPESWLHALELRREIKRLRPQWLRAVVSKRRLRGFLQAHRARWEEARRGTMPDPDAYSVFRRDFEGGVSHTRQAQQELRQELRKGSTEFTLVTPHGDTLPVAAGDPEIYWRYECLQVWYNAIEVRTQSCE